MNSFLADWHADIAINLPAEVLEARETAGDAVVANLSGDQLLDLISLAYQQPGSSDGGEWFRAAIKEQDRTFLLRGNDREVAVLAGACLWAVLDGDGLLAILAGYGCAVAAFRDWISAPPELSNRAEHRLSELAVAERALANRPDLGKPQAWSKQLQTSIKTAAPEETDINGTHIQAVIGKVMTALQTALDRLYDQQTKIVTWAEQALDVYAEESAQVGWLLGGASRTLSRPWASIDRAAAAVLAGRELANSVLQLAAPPHSDAFLDQMLAATPFSEHPVETVLEPLSVPDALHFLIAPLPNSDEPGRQARHSLRQAMLVQAWEQLT